MQIYPLGTLLVRDDLALGLLQATLQDNDGSDVNDYSWRGFGTRAKNGERGMGPMGCSDRGP